MSETEPKPSEAPAQKAKHGANWFYLKVVAPLSVIGGAVALLVWVFDLVNTSNDPATRSDIEAVMGERVLVDRDAVRLMVLDTLAQQRGGALDGILPGEIGFLEARLISASAQNITASSAPMWQSAQLAIGRGDLAGAARETEAIATGQTGLQAAKGWRDAAMLYLVDDPERAIVALDRAAALQPDDFETQLALSRAHLLSGGDISMAWSAAQEAVGLAKTAEQTAAATLALGLAMQANGELLGAVDAYQRTADILKTLIRSQPETLQLQQVRLDALKRLYRVLNDLERYDEAGAALNHALDTAHAVHALDPTIWTKEELSLLLVWYGDLLHESRDDSTGARAAYLEALAIDESIALAKGNDALARYGLLFPLKRLVDLARFESDKPAQRDLYLQMLEIEIALNEAEPGSIWPSMIAFRYERLAGLGDADTQQYWAAAYNALLSEKKSGGLNTGDEEMLEYYAGKAGLPYP